MFDKVGRMSGEEFQRTGAAGGCQAGSEQVELQIMPSCHHAMPSLWSRRG